MVAPGLLTISISYNNLKDWRCTQEVGISTQSEEPKKQKRITGLAIPADLFIGMGEGFLIDNLTAGIFMELGGGFLYMIIVRAKLGEW